VSDSPETHLSDIRGDVHTGNGDINKITNLVLSDSLLPSPRKQPADELQWLRQRFVEPPGLGKARDVLESSRTVFLDGPPGSGRTTAARMLLWELENGESHIHELLIEDNKPYIDHDRVGDRDLVWLDLSMVTDTQWVDVQSELSSLRAKIHDRDAHLVVILPETPARLASPLAQYRVEIQRPAADDVLARYLLVEDIPRPLPLPRLDFLDVERSPEEVAEYVRLICRAREDNHEGGFRVWCEEALHAFSGHSQDVTTQVKVLSSGPQRALLLAVAMLHGAHLDVIHRAGTDLLTAVEHPSEETSLLERVPLDQRLAEIGAKIDSSERVWFEKLDYDRALRSYFWTRMPDIRDPLQKWVKRAVDSPDSYPPDELTHLIERFTEQCLSSRYLSKLASLVDEWTTHPTTPRKVEAAALMLQRGLRDERQNRFFRSKIYDWSQRDSLSDQLAEVIITACRDEMMVRHPDEALVRLHHVARRERGTHAHDTLIELAGRAPRLRRQLLNRVTHPHFSSGEWPRDVDLFLMVADPVALADPGPRDQALIADSAIRQRLATGWSQVFTKRGSEVWSPTVRRWLDVAATDARHRHALLEVLVCGGAAQPGVVTRLCTMTREREAWAPLGEAIRESLRTVRTAPDRQLA